MPKIMKPQIFNPQDLASACECGADGIGRVGEDFWFHPRHRFGDRERLGWKLAVDIVADLVAGMLHVADEDPVVIEIVP